MGEGTAMVQKDQNKRAVAVEMVLRGTTLGIGGVAAISKWPVRRYRNVSRLMEYCMYCPVLWTREFPTGGNERGVPAIPHWLPSWRLGVPCREAYL